MTAVAHPAGRLEEAALRIVRLRWLWLVGAVIFLAIAHFTRYEHIAWVTDGGAEIRWDRWLHRTCVYPVRGQHRCF